MRNRRRFLKLLGTSAIALAGLPNLEEVTRKVWPGYSAVRDANQIIAGRDVIVDTGPWTISHLTNSPWIAMPLADPEINYYSSVFATHIIHQISQPE